jgi:hypothetical protein
MLAVVMVVLVLAIATLVPVFLVLHNMPRRTRY